VRFALRSGRCSGSMLLTPVPMRGLFITGTDTGVGKTFVACGILRHLRANGVRAGAYKPVCSGAEVLSDSRLRWPDVDALAEALRGEFPSARICPQCFTAPLAPPLAAAREGRQIDPSLLISGRDWWSDRVDVLIVEGAGGLLSPIAAGVSNADLARQLAYPVVVVAADRLGTINHTLLTVEAALTRGLRVAGVVLNRQSDPPDASVESNRDELLRLCPAPVLGVWPYKAIHSLRAGSGGIRIDWQALASARIT
jgi:dethiobiotin synthetase